MTDEQWKRIFNAISDDIVDRRDIGVLWNEMQPSIKREISAAWYGIITCVLLPSSGMHVFESYEIARAWCYKNASGRDCSVLVMQAGGLLVLPRLWRRITPNSRRRWLDASVYAKNETSI